MNYKESIKYIESSSWGLKNTNNIRMKKLMSYFNNPQDKLKIVHIAGTNGKGSCAAYLNNIFYRKGYKTGLYTSPHLIKYEERIIANNKMISSSDFSKYVTKVKHASNRLKLNLTVFEILTAVSFMYFYDQKCEIVFIEVGLGGRFDATNIIKKPLLSIIMNIGKDHTKILGNTLKEIAYEKAGIIKNRCDVLVYSNSKQIMDVIKKEVNVKKTNLYISDFRNVIILNEGLDNQLFNYRNLNNIELSLLGNHQFYNASVVIDACYILNSKGFNISDFDIRKGLKTTKWDARLSILNRNPLFILDGGHNPQCAKALNKSLPKLIKTKAIIICGILKDKDYKNIIRNIEDFAEEFVLISPNSNRALKAEDLSKIIQKNIKTTTCSSVNEGIYKSLILSNNKKPIIAFGSLYLAGDIKKNFNKVYKKYLNNLN